MADTRCDSAAQGEASRHGAVHNEPSLSANLKYPCAACSTTLKHAGRDVDRNPRQASSGHKSPIACPAASHNRKMASLFLPILTTRCACKTHPGMRWPTGMKACPIPLASTRCSGHNCVPNRIPACRSPAGQGRCSGRRCRAHPRRATAAPPQGPAAAPAASAARRCCAGPCGRWPTIRGGPQ